MEGGLGGGLLIGICALCLHGSRRGRGESTKAQGRPAGPGEAPLICGRPVMSPAWGRALILHPCPAENQRPPEKETLCGQKVSRPPFA